MTFPLDIERLRSDAFEQGYELGNIANECVILIMGCEMELIPLLHKPKPNKGRLVKLENQIRRTLDILKQISLLTAVTINATSSEELLNLLKSHLDGDKTALEKIRQLFIDRALTGKRSVIFGTPKDFYDLHLGT